MSYLGGDPRNRSLHHLVAVIVNEITLESIVTQSDTNLLKGALCESHLRVL